MTNLQDIRRDYSKSKLDKKTIENDPFFQFDKWMKEALAGGFLEPPGFVLSTCGKNGMPSSRVLLLKEYDSNGFVFYSNYLSRKGNELEENPKASMLFYWDKFERQIRINGSVEKITREHSDAYFQRRPYTSRLGAWASEQSRELKSRFSLMRKVASLMVKYPKNVPLPDHWGGYRLIPEEFEFWQGRTSRLHDRFSFIKNGDKWEITRLAP